MCQCQYTLAALDVYSYRLWFPLSPSTRANVQTLA